jgi:hypothetical protein
MCEQMSREAYTERINDCAGILREISDSKVLGDGTRQTWACGIASGLLRDLSSLLDELAEWEASCDTRDRMLCDKETELVGLREKLGKRSAKCIDLQDEVYGLREQIATQQAELVELREVRHVIVLPDCSACEYQDGTPCLHCIGAQMFENNLFRQKPAAPEQEGGERK